jgi:hypothetical protein
MAVLEGPLTWLHGGLAAAGFTRHAVLHSDSRLSLFVDGRTNKLLETVHAPAPRHLPRSPCLLPLHSWPDCSRAVFFPLFIYFICANVLRATTGASLRQDGDCARGRERRERRPVDRGGCCCLPPARGARRRARSLLRVPRREGGESLGGGHGCHPRRHCRAARQVSAAPDRSIPHGGNWGWLGEWRALRFVVVVVLFVGGVVAVLLLGERVPPWEIGCIRNRGNGSISFFRPRGIDGTRCLFFLLLFWFCCNERVAPQRERSRRPETRRDLAFLSIAA